MIPGCDYDGCVVCGVPCEADLCDDCVGLLANDESDDYDPADEVGWSP